MSSGKEWRSWRGKTVSDRRRSRDTCPRTVSMKICQVIMWLWICERMFKRMIDYMHRRNQRRIAKVRWTRMKGSISRRSIAWRQALITSSSSVNSSKQGIVATANQTHNSGAEFLLMRCRKYSQICMIEVRSKMGQAAWLETSRIGHSQNLRISSTRVPQTSLNSCSWRRGKQTAQDLEELSNRLPDQMETINQMRRINKSQADCWTQTRTLSWTSIAKVQNRRSKERTRRIKYKIQF